MDGAEVAYIYGRRVSTVGTVHPHLEVKIVDSNSGRTVPLGEAGEICTRGYSVMIKYWGDEKATKKAKDEMGWMYVSKQTEVSILCDTGIQAI